MDAPDFIPDSGGGTAVAEAPDFIPDAPKAAAPDFIRNAPAPKTEAPAFIADAPAPSTPAPDIDTQLKAARNEYSGHQAATYYQDGGYSGSMGPLPKMDLATSNPDPFHVPTADEKARELRSLNAVNNVYRNDKTSNAISTGDFTSDPAAQQITGQIAADNAQHVGMAGAAAGAFARAQSGVMNPVVDVARSMMGESVAQNRARHAMDDAAQAAIAQRNPVSAGVGGGVGTILSPGAIGATALTGGLINPADLTAAELAEQGVGTATKIIAGAGRAGAVMQSIGAGDQIAAGQMPTPEAALKNQIVGNVAGPVGEAAGAGVNTLTKGLSPVAQGVARFTGGAAASGAVNTGINATTAAASGQPYDIHQGVRDFIVGAAQHVPMGVPEAIDTMRAARDKIAAVDPTNSVAQKLDAEIATHAVGPKPDAASTTPPSQSAPDFIPDQPPSPAAESPPPATPSEPPAANVFSDNMYERLGVPANASASDIKTAWRQRAAELHPDRPGGSNETAAMVNEAGRVLLDDALRSKYDKGGMDAVRGEEKARAVQRSRDIRNGTYQQEQPNGDTSTTAVPTEEAQGSSAAGNDAHGVPQAEPAAVVGRGDGGEHAPAQGEEVTPPDFVPDAAPSPATQAPRTADTTPPAQGAAIQPRTKSASDVLLRQGVSDGLFPNDFEGTGDDRAAMHPDTLANMSASQKQTARGMGSEDRFSDATAGMNAQQIAQYERSTAAKFAANKDQRTQDAIEHYKGHPDPNLRRLAAYADAEGTGPKSSVSVEKFHDGDKFTLGGREFTVKLDPEGGTHFEDHDIDIPHADTLPDGRMKIDSGSWDKSGRGKADEPFAPPAARSREVDLRKLPDYVRDTINQRYGQAQRAGVVDAIEASAAQRKTALETATDLAGKIPGSAADQRDIVRAVRAKLGIPSLDDGTAFEKWLSDKNASTNSKPTRNITENVPTSTTVSTKTSGPQGSLLGERFEGSGNGSKTGSMFGDTRPGAASELEAKGNEVGQAKKDNETEEMFDKSNIGQTGLGDAPPGPLQIGNIAKLAGVTLKGIGKEALGDLRYLRERFSPIEAKYGSDVAKAFIKTVAAPSAEANTLAGSFMRRAFGDAPDPAKAAREWTDLGRYYRLRDMQQRYPNQPVGQGLPPLPAAEVARLEADPVMQRATAMYNKEIAPLINDIRTRNGMVMNSAANDPKKFPFFLNLPGENDGPAGTDTSVNPNFAFNNSANGNSQLLMDPKESMAAAIRGHLATDYKQQLVKTIKANYSIPQASAVPSGKNTYSATYKGKTIEVAPIDLAPSGTMQTDVQYVPKQIAAEWRGIKQDRGEYNTLIDKAIQLGTKVATIGDFSPHAARVVAHVAARQAQSGHNIFGILPSWLGSIPSSITRMTQMAKTPIGETLQLLIDRSGSDKGQGFDVKPGQSRLSQLLAVPHDILFDPDHGVDPMGRRVIADAHLRTLFGNDVMDGVEKDLKAGATTPAEASKMIEAKMSDAQFVGLGRKVNATLGFANKQTRSELLNWLSRVSPFISSESGMIPREVAKVANVDVPGMVSAAKRGAWGQMAKMVAGSIATGAIGTYLLSNAINYTTTKAQTGKGRMLSDNDDGHKMDIAVAPGWHLSNLDPTFSRGMRLTGLTGAANDKGLFRSMGMEAINELLSIMAKTAQVYLTTATALTGSPSSAHFVQDDKSGKLQLMPTDPKEMGGIPLVRNSVHAAITGKPLGPAMIQDAASTIAGATLKYSGDTRTKAELLAAKIGGEHVSEAPMTPEEKAKYQAKEQVIKLRRAGDNAGVYKAFTDAKTTGTLTSNDWQQIVQQAKFKDDLAYHVSRMSADDAVKTFEAMTPEERATNHAVVWEKIMNAKSLKPAERKDLRDRFIKARDAVNE